jgi:UPF0755 protein
MSPPNKPAQLGVTAGIFLLCLCIILMLAFMGLIAIPNEIQSEYGEPSPRLTYLQVLDYTYRLRIQKADLEKRPEFVYGGGNITIKPGETPYDVGNNLVKFGYISNVTVFVDYLVYKGYDTKIRAGEFKVSAGMNIPDVANLITDFENTVRNLIVLAGWRQEEVAEALPLNGINVEKGDFLTYLTSMEPSQFSPILGDFSGFEGLLFPGTYTFSRSAGPDVVLSTLVRSFLLALSDEWAQAIQRNGLSIHQAIILASIIERESIVGEEDVIIASVFYNRLRSGMSLESDPTVQYSLGYQAASGTWWKSPLYLEDLQINSEYNTYQINGFPPAPICSPGLSAIKAVAFPAETNYYYFRAKCDQSGLHNFSDTYQGHINNACP